jgi:hypothetical protein
MQHRGKRLKSFKSQKEHCETGIETEKYAQLELLQVIDGTISIPLSIQKAIPESESFTPELARTNKNQTLNDKRLTCNPCSQTDSLSKTSAPDSTTQLKDYFPFWDKFCQETSEKLWSATKTDSFGSVLTSSNGSVNSLHCQLVVLNRSDLSPEREMVEDILAIVHVFSCRLYGLRKYKSVIKEDSDLPRDSLGVYVVSMDIRCPMVLQSSPIHT